MNWYWWVLLGLVVAAVLAAGVVVLARRQSSRTATQRILHQPRTEDHVAAVGAVGVAADQPEAVLPDYDPIGEERLEALRAGRVGEPVADESVGVVAGPQASSSADLDDDVADDAVGEAREQWWEPTDDVDDVEEGLRGR